MWRFGFYSLRHTFVSLARNADAAGFLIFRAMGHATSGLVDQVYADALPFGMAHLAEQLAERALGTKPALRALPGGKPRDIRQPSDESLDAGTKDTASG